MRLIRFFLEIEGVFMKRYTTYSIVILLIFSLFGCSKPKRLAKEAVNNKTETKIETPNVENNQDIPIKYPVIIDKSISNICDENHFYDIPIRKIDDSPVKPWNPIWNYPRKNGGWISAHKILSSNPDMILIKDPMADYDSYHNSYQRETYFDDYRAVTPNNNKEIWNYRINITSGSTILLQGDSLFIGTAEGTRELQDNFFVFCINKNTGKEIWKCPIAGITKTNMIFSDNKLYFGTHKYDGNFIYCVDAVTGKILFQNPGPENIEFDYYTKYVLVDNVLYFSNPDHPGIYGFNISSKQYFLLWKPNQKDGMEYMSELSYVDPYLFFEETTGFDDSKSALKAINLKENKLVWTITFQSNSMNYLNEPEYDGKNIFFSSFNFIASIDPMTRKINWSFSKGRIENRPIDIREFMFNDKNVFIGIEEEPKFARDTDQFYRRYLLSMDKKTGEILWKMQKGVILNCIYKDKLIVSDDKNLYMIDQK